MTTAFEKAATWMKDAIDRDGVLYQEIAAPEIASLFGEEVVYINNNGNYGISKEVLSIFKSLTGDTVIWERGSRLWRKREDYDMPGRQQY